MECRTDDYLCIASNCSGRTMSGTELFNYWIEHDCPAAYSQIINTSPSGALQYNSSAQLQVQEDISHLFNTYMMTNQITDDVTSAEFNVFQDTLLSTCLDPTLPGVCEKYLDGYCRQYTRSQVIDSPVLTNFCGCYTPPNPEYLKYTKDCTSGTCVEQPACDPICHRALTSHRAVQQTGVILACPQNICVIDDAVITTDNSRVSEGINFNTVCSGCSGPDGCLCIVAGTNISATMAQIGVGTNFNEFCGEHSVCLVEDSQGNIISSGGCTGINPLNIEVTGGIHLPNLGILFILFLTVLLILFIVIAARYSDKRD